jgi:hypothetical protein
VAKDLAKAALVVIKAVVIRLIHATNVNDDVTVVQHCRVTRPKIRTA